MTAPAGPGAGDLDDVEYVNRETWALQQWLTRDPDLWFTGRSVAADGDEDDAAGWVQEWIEQDVWWQMAKTHDGRVFCLEVGSLWRVDWHATARLLRAAGRPAAPGPR